jgi:hypothetical protein
MRQITGLYSSALGVKIDTQPGNGITVYLETPPVKHIWTDASTPRQGDQRASERHPVAFPARLTWKDQRGTTRFASVVARNVSEYGVYVECQSVVSLPLYRLVQFQLEREARDGDALPDALKQGRVLSAVYRVSSPTPSKPQGFALRLMVDPKRRVAAVEAARATA